MVANTCNPDYMRSIGRKRRLAWAKSMRPYLKNKKAKGLCPDSSCRVLAEQHKAWGSTLVTEKKNTNIKRFLFRSHVNGRVFSCS
jgi:hypothetical protein